MEIDLFKCAFLTVIHKKVKFIFIVIYFNKKLQYFKIVVFNPIF